MPNSHRTIARPEFPVYYDTPSSLTGGLWLQRLLAVSGLPLLIIAVIHYPTIPYWLLAGILIYMAALLYQPYSWLLTLPVIIPLLNLAPWSGRLLIEDYDHILLATVIIGLWRGQYGGVRNWKYYKTALLLLLLLSISYLISLIRGLTPLQALDFNAFAIYESHYNALRAGKGFLWALVLLPMLLYVLQQDKEKAFASLMVGAAIGLTANGMVILWERGTLAALLGGNDIYGIVGSLLDFSTPYRVTGLFSEMHTGGAAIDGYLTLTWSFCLAMLLLSAHRPLWIALGISGLLFGIYAIAVTFTRITYGGLVVSILLFFIGVWSSRPKALPKLAVGEVFVLLAIAFLVLYFSFLRGGSMALAPAMAALVGGALFGAVGARLTPIQAAIALVLSGLILLYLLVRAQLTSKWVEHGSSLEVLVVSLGFILLLIGIGLRTIHRTARLVNVRVLLMLLMGLTMVSGMVILGLANYRMEERFSTVSQDSENRIGHWRAVLGAMDNDWDAMLFGMGLGRFPKSYLMAYPDERREIGSYSFDKMGGNGYLRIGSGGGIGVAQRVSLAPFRSYTLSMQARSNYKGQLGIEICRRNILYAEAYQGSGCKFFTAEIESSGAWRPLKLAVDSGPVSAGSWYMGWPVALLIHNYGGHVVDIDNIKLIDISGRDYLQNGDFEQGGDHWFSYNDFYHLPWHVKNLWVNFYFDQGILGVIAFALALFYVVGRNILLVRQADLLALVLLTSLTGFMVVGMADNPLDAPRIMLLFYLLMFCGLFHNPTPAFDVRHE